METMTQTDKELLLKDLASRLPYGVKISIPDLWSQNREVEILDDIFKGNEVELQLGDYEIEVRDGKIYAIKKKPVYPKILGDCCKVIVDIGDFQMCGYKHELLFNFQNLLICRDAYWKIAGEEMGLGKPWEFENPAKRYVFTIEYSGGNIILNAAVDSMRNRILVFPTEEMRDAFYENFKDLIEQVIELL